MEQNPQAEQEERQEPDTTALAPQASAAVPANVAGNDLGRGHEEASDMEELEIPFAKLVQFTSDEAQTENAAERVDPGALINSITKDKLGLSFVPIFKFTEYTKWNPRKKDDPNFDPAYDPGAMVFKTTNRNDPRVIEGIKFGEGGEPPPVTRNMNFLCLFVDHPYPLVLTFKKTSFAAGKRLNTLTQFAGGDMFSGKYKLAISLEESDGSKYFKLNVLPDGKATPEEYAQAEKWFNDFRGKDLKVHADEESGDKTGQEWPK